MMLNAKMTSENRPLGLASLKSLGTLTRAICGVVRTKAYIE